MKEPPGEVVPQEIHDNLITFRSTLHYFDQTKAANKPVGYLDLGPVNHDLDVDKILNKGLQQYPCLCIVHYNNDQGQSVLEMRSAKFQLNQTKVEITQKNHYAEIGQLLNQLAGQVMAAAG